MIHTDTYTAWKWQFRWNEKDVCRWNFCTSEIHTAAVYTVANYFCWSRPNVTYFMPNAFKNTKSFRFTENTV